MYMYILLCPWIPSFVKNVQHMYIDGNGHFSQCVIYQNFERDEKHQGKTLLESICLTNFQMPHAALVLTSACPSAFLYHNKKATIVSIHQPLYMWLKNIN